MAVVGLLVGRAQSSFVTTIRWFARIPRDTSAKHQAQQAVPLLEKAVSVSHRSPGIVGLLVMAYAQARRRSDALRLLAELKKREQPGYSEAFVLAYLGLGYYD